MPLSRRLAVAVVASAVSGAVVGCSGIRGAADTGPVPFTVDRGGGSGHSDLVGTVGLAPIARIDVTAPVTILAVRPLRVDRGMRVLAVRAWFHGFGTSASGHRQYNDLPSSVCVREPVTGYGPSYPVEGLELRPGDQPHFVVWAKAETVGKHRVSGVRIDYRMPGQPKRSIDDEGLYLQVTAHRPGDTGYLRCRPYDRWARPDPAYPR